MRLAEQIITKKPEPKIFKKVEINTPHSANTNPFEIQTWYDVIVNHLNKYLVVLIHINHLIFEKTYNGTNFRFHFRVYIDT